MAEATGTAAGGGRQYVGLLETAVEAAEAAGDVLKKRFRRPGEAGGAAIELKAPNDLVSEADREAEEALLEVLLDHDDEAHILAEESGFSGEEDAALQWIVDPLDGTSNFLHGLPIWSVSVAGRVGGRTVVGVVHEPLAGNTFTAVAGAGAFWNGRSTRVPSGRAVSEAFLATGYPFRAHPALDPYLGLFRDVFFGVRGIRRCGSAALDLAYVAAGIFDGFFELRLSPWDVAAGALLVQQAGGVVTDLDGGEDYLWSGNILAGAPDVHEALRRWCGAHLDEAKLDELVPRAVRRPRPS